MYKILLIEKIAVAVNNMASIRRLNRLLGHGGPQMAGHCFRNLGHQRGGHGQISTSR